MRQMGGVIQSQMGGSRTKTPSSLARTEAFCAKAAGRACHCRTSVWISTSHGSSSSLATEASADPAEASFVALGPLPLATINLLHPSLTC